MYWFRYSRVRNKHTPTLINFWTFFQWLRLYSGLHRAYFSSMIIMYKWGYAYSFCQIFQRLRLFKGLHSFQTLEYFSLPELKNCCQSHHCLYRLVHHCLWQIVDFLMYWEINSELSELLWAIPFHAFALGEFHHWNRGSNTCEPEKTHTKKQESISITTNGVRVFEFELIALKFIYSEKAAKFCEIFHLLLTTVHTKQKSYKCDSQLITGYLSE